MEREQDGKGFNHIPTRKRMRTENRLEGNGEDIRAPCDSWQGMMCRKVGHQAQDIRAQAAARPWV